MIPDSFIEELKYVCEIEQIINTYIDLKRRGRNLTGLCPFHSEKTPSFTVYPDTQSYYCFGCGNGGDVITFIRQVENLEYIEALQLLAQRGGLVFPDLGKDDGISKLKSRILEINRESARFFHDALVSDLGKPSRVYLSNRGITSKSIRRFGIGFAPDAWDSLRNHLTKKGYTEQELIEAAVVTRGRNNSVYDNFRNRIIFPIIDLRGNVVGFGGRLMGERGPKYLNSPDTPIFKKSRHLFALNFAKNTSSDTLILGEGYMDVIAMHQAGFENAVATLGTSLTEEQSRLISQYATKVVIAYDSDGAGQNAAKRAINLFSKTNISVSVLQLEGAKDPDEYIQKFGAVRFANLLEGGKSAMHFEIDKLRQNHDFAISEDKVTFLNEFCRLMSQIDNTLQRDVYIGEIARELEVSPDSIRTTVDSIRTKNFKSKQNKQSRSLATSISERGGTETKKYRKNLKGLVAEELLITMLLLHPDHYDTVKKSLTADDFLDAGFKEIYTVIAGRLDGNLPLELIHLSSSLPPKLMAEVSSMLLKGQTLKFYPTQITEYIQAIKMQQEKKDAQQLADMSAEDYQEYLSQLRADKK